MKDDNNEIPLLSLYQPCKHVGDLAAMLETRLYFDMSFLSNTFDSEHTVVIHVAACSGVHASKSITTLHVRPLSSVAFEVVFVKRRMRATRFESDLKASCLEGAPERRAAPNL